MNIFLKVSKTVAFNVKKSETIKNLKAMLCKKEGISEYFPELFFSGERLKDDCKLVDCGIQKNSTLHLVLQNSGIIKLFICIPSMTKTSEVEVKVHDTIQNIKSLIQVREGIHTDRFTLFHAGILLEDFRTLDSLGIKGESTLHLIFDPKDEVSISVKLVTGGVVKTKVKLLYTVHDVKAIVGSIAGVAVNDQTLIYSGKQLEDSKTLAFYKIIEESILEMVFADIGIFVKHHNGKTISVDVCQHDTITDAKNKIFMKLGIPVDSDFEYLIFAGKQLESDRDLASYGIEKNCTLSVCIRALKVCVSIPSMKKTLEFEVTVFDTIQKIKALMRVREGIEADHYIFHYDGILLEDYSSSFASLGIKKTEATLVVTAKPKLGIHSIYVETATGMIVKTEVSSLYTVRLVKSLVGSIAGVPAVGDHTLIYEGVPLQDWRILGSYNIKETSVVKMKMTASQNPNTSFSWNISIFVKPWSGKTITLYVGRYDTVKAVKTKIFGKLGIPCTEFHYLSFCGKALDDGKNLATYGIKKDNTIHVNCRFSPC